VPPVAPEQAGRTLAEQASAAYPVNESRNMASTSAAPADPQFVSRNKGRTPKTNDLVGVVPASDAIDEERAAVRKRKSARNTKRKRPLDTENV